MKVFFVKIASVIRRAAGFSALSDKQKGHNRDPVNKKRTPGRGG